MPGATDDSYGIEVAKLAGVPREVIKRAGEILEEMLNERPVERPSRGEDDSAIDIGEVINEGVIDDIRAADLNNMSPVEALNLLFELQKRLR